ncbi:DNA kinase/phosphatase Pnk1 [Aulographum hederae CBS 113979]|uniref:DNA kinase/phosphatase Pnk1 n=1 Tax=Aulographum hederae CBS 113979 TaxID=1176131 RepID=A0A6G1HEC5_9PEZI|nr:DNA kinase/phosphatase Pnk1 [Aulographum hederae CBS 113979]
MPEAHPPSLKRRNSDDGSISPPPVKRKQQSTTTSKAVANFFTPVSKKAPEKISWRVVKDSLLIGKYDDPKDGSASGPTSSKTKVAAFDFDSTLIKTASGNRFGRDATDWQWWHGSIPQKLRAMSKDGYIIAIISNQAGISLKPNPKSIKSDQKRLADFKTKVSAVFTQLDLPVSIYAATTRDEYRKPRPGMWREFLEDQDLEIDDRLDLSESIFVGDAGGRPAEGGSVKDFSCSDRDFAANVGLKYHTPEEFFLGESPKPFIRDFDPSEHTSTATAPLDSNPLVFAKTNDLDIVMFCGSPGAGKSSFYWKHLQELGYERVNQDLLKTRDKCIKAATRFLEQGVPVVIDNTNAEPEIRAVWIQLARKFDIPIRCVHFTASAKLCEHNDAVRSLNVSSMNPEKRTMLPKVAFTSFTSRYKEPALTEGFEDIVKVDFIFEGTPDQKDIWCKYWI